MTDFDVIKSWFREFIERMDSLLSKMDNPEGVKAYYKGGVDLARHAIKRIEELEEMKRRSL